MASVDFFPKLDRSVDLKESNAKASAASSAKAAQAAKKNALASSPLESNSSTDQTSFADVLERDRTANEPAVADKPVRSVKKDTPLRPENSQVKAVENRSDDERSEKSALKQKAVTQFIDEMQSKFGVSTEEVLSAFAQLDEEALNGRPEDAMSQFLVALQIPQEQMPEAGKLYMKMVRETGDAILGEKVTGDKAVVAFEVVSPKEMKLKKINDSVTQLSDKFFSGSQSSTTLAANGLGLQDPNSRTQNSEDYIAKILGQQSSNDVQAKGAQTTPSATDQKSNDGKMSLFGLGLAATGAATLATPKLAGQAKQMGEAGGTAASLANDLTQGLNSADQSSSFASLESAMSGENSSGFDSQQNGGNDQTLENMLSKMQASASQLAPSAFAAAAAQAAKGAYEATTTEPRASEKDVSKSVDASDVSVAGLGQTSPTAEAKLPLAAGGMMLAEPTMTPEQRQDNINEIIRQAQVIVKEGGGEMKMELRPEGIGHVHLKVMVQDGKVDVQMLTESDSAKKLLESGLDDLKLQLAANKLQVETMKVEAGADAAFKKFEQSMGDQQREQARQFASDFMGQFRDERQSFFSNYMDRGGNSRGYRSDSRKRGNVDPTQVDGVVQANSTSNGRESNGNRRLNLVA